MNMPSDTIFGGASIEQLHGVRIALLIVIKFGVLAMYGEFFSMSDMNKGCSFARSLPKAWR